MGLKGVPTMISPELLKVLAEMGHGDSIVLADAHFPGTAIGVKNNVQVIRADAVDVIPKLLSAIFVMIDLDTYCPNACIVMDRTDEDKHKGVSVPYYQVYNTMVGQLMNRFDDNIYYAERYSFANRVVKISTRHEFYEVASKAYAIVMTGDDSVYGNIIVTKGITRGIPT